MTAKFAKKLSRDPYEMDHELCVSILVSSIQHTNVVFRNCSFNVGGKNFLVDLVKIEMQGFGVILGMDWLAKYELTIDCKRKLVSLTTFGGETLKHKGSNPQKSILIISAMQAFRMMRKDFQGYLCVLEVTTSDEPNFSEILVANEFSKIFKDISRLLPDRDAIFQGSLSNDTSRVS